MLLGNLYIAYYHLSMIKHDYFFKLIYWYEQLCISELTTSHLIDCMSW
jgi:hypothetical protein